MLGGKGLCQTEREFLRPTEGPVGPTKSLPNQHKSLSGQQSALWRHEGTLVGQKRHLSGGLRDSHKLKVGILGPKEDPLRPKVGPFRPAKAPRKLAKAYPC